MESKTEHIDISTLESKDSRAATDADNIGSPFREPFDSRLGRMGASTNTARLVASYSEAVYSSEEVLKLLRNPFMQPEISDSIKEKIASLFPKRLENTKKHIKSNGKAYIETLLQLFEETGISRSSIEPDVKNWISGNKGISKRNAFKLCFALKLDAKGAKDFLNEALFLNAFCARDIEHAFYSFGLQFGLSYTDTEALLVKYVVGNISKENRELLKSEYATRIICGDFLKSFDFFGSIKMSELDPCCSLAEILEIITNKCPNEKRKEDACAVIGCLKGCVDSSALKQSKKEFLSKALCLCKTSKGADSSDNRRRNVTNYFNRYWADGFMQWFNGLDSTKRQQLNSCAFEQLWGGLDKDLNKLLECVPDHDRWRQWSNLEYDLDLLLDVFAEFVAKAKHDIHMPRSETTRAHEHIMTQILNGSFNDNEFQAMVKDLRGFLSLTSSYCENDENIWGKQRALGLWFCERRKASGEDFIGYSKTAYQEYLRYRKRVSEIMRNGAITEDEALSIEELELIIKKLKVKDIQIVEHTYGSYLTLDENANTDGKRAKKNKELRKKRIAEWGVEEIPNKQVLSEVRKEPWIFSNNEKARSVLFLMYFYYYVNDQAQMLEEYRETYKENYRKFAQIHHENFFAFWNNLHIRAEEWGMPAPYPRRRFDFLLLRAMALPDFRNRDIQKKAEEYMKKNPYIDPERAYGLAAEKVDGWLNDRKLTPRSVFEQVLIYADDPSNLEEYYEFYG